VAREVRRHVYIDDEVDDGTGAGEYPAEEDVRLGKLKAEIVAEALEKKW